tara:strand:+ start:155 stop:451 length:297 start_codon:yes stop_codon:yes gene_type:complete
MSRWWKKFKVKQKKTTPDFNKRRAAFRGASRKIEVDSIKKELKAVTGKDEKIGKNVFRDIDETLVKRNLRGDYLKKVKKATDRTADHLKRYEDIYKKK